MKTDIGTSYIPSVNCRFSILFGYSYPKYRQPAPARPLARQCGAARAAASSPRPARARSRNDRDRKSVVQGKSVDLGGRRIIKKKK